MNESSTKEINRIWSGIISSEIKKLKEWLKISEDEFFSFDPKNSENCLEWWMYSVLDDLMRFQIKTITMEDLFLPEWQLIEDIKFSDELKKWLNLKRLLFESYSFELDFWHRKFLEHFIQIIHLISIPEKNRLKIAKIYLLASDLLEFANKLKDDKFSYWIENEAEWFWFQHDFNFIKKLINELGSCIFIDQNFNEKDAKGKLKIFSSYKNLYDDILSRKLATENDRLLLGGTYYHYHSLTQSIHAHCHNNEKNFEIDTLLIKINHIFLLEFKLLYYIWLVIWFESSHHVKLFAISPLEEWMDFTVQKYEKWDLMLYRWAIYEILDILKSANTWYYKIQIQTHSWIWTSVKWIRQEDRNLKRVLYLWNVRSIVSWLDNMDSKNMELILSMPDNELYSAFKSIVLDLYKAGLNIFSYKW